jgi:hypothetical protein
VFDKSTPAMSKMLLTELGFPFSRPDDDLRR